MTLHGVTSSIPMNQDYRYVVRNTLSIGMRNVPQVFEQNKDEYYRRVLSDVGNYPSGIDFKHYDDPRCKCLLCWTFRKGFEYDYPTVKAKLLCIIDQLKNENIHRNMRFDDFKIIVYEHISGLQPRMVDFLWDSIFKGKPRQTKEETFDVQPDIERILSTFDIIGLRRMDEFGISYPDNLQTSIKELQDRIDKEYDAEKKATNICNMSMTELIRSHRDRLRDRLTLYRQSVDTQPLVSLWKKMFRHDYIMENMSKSRIEKADYAGFEGIRKADKQSILNVKLSESEAVISALKIDLYLLDPLARAKIEAEYEKFNDEFGRFLPPGAIKDFTAFSKSDEIDNRVSRNYRSVKVKYELEYLKQMSQRLIRDERWIPILKDTLDLIEKEKDIHRFGFQPKIQTRLNCTTAVRDYIEKIWQSIRDGQTEYRGITLEDFNELRDTIYKERMLEYKQKYVDSRLVQFYSLLPLEKRRSVDKKMINHMLQKAKEFRQKNNLTSFYSEDDTRKQFKKEKNYDTASEVRQRELVAEYKGDGGYEEKQKLDFYIWEFSTRIRVDDYIRSLLSRSRKKLDPSLLTYTLRVVSYFMEKNGLETFYSGQSDEERLSCYIQEFRMCEYTRDHVRIYLKLGKAPAINPASISKDRLLKYMLHLVVKFMNDNKLKTRYREENTREKFENTNISYETYEMSERLQFFLDEFFMGQITKDYVDGKLAGRTMKPGRNINYMIGVVVEFMQENNILTTYNENATRKQYKQENNMHELSTKRQMQLFKAYKEYEQQKRLDFYIEEFAQKKSLWDAFSQKLDVRAMWDTYSEKLNIQNMWNEFSQSRNIPALWKVISWHELQRKNRLVWQWVWEEINTNMHQEMMNLRDRYMREAETTNLVDNITAEMYLMFDIFNKWRVDNDTLDRFISKNLPPKERTSFVIEMRDLEKLTGYEVEVRKEYVRSAYKKIVFDKEIVKRAVILRLKERNNRIREAWNEKVLDGSITSDLSELQIDMQQTYDDYRELGLVDRFPYDREWVVFKYRNIHRWLAVNARVFVDCTYADVANKTQEWEYKSSVTTSSDVPMVGSNMPTEWSDANQKTEDVLVAWIESIDTEFVYVRLEKTLTIQKGDQVQNLDVVKIDIHRVYDSILDYNQMSAYTAVQEQKEKERVEELEMLRELDRQRRDLIRKITVEDASDEEKVREEIDRATENALLMYDESKSEERRRLFNEWMEPIRAIDENLPDTTKAKELIPYVASRVAECRQYGGKVKFEMFRNGRKEWLKSSGIEEKLQFKENLPRENMRTRKEQMEFKWSLKIIEDYETNAKRSTAIKVTNEFEKFLFVYSDAVIKLIIMDKIEGMTPDEKRKNLDVYKKDMKEAKKRFIKRFEKDQKAYFTSMMQGSLFEIPKRTRGAIERRSAEIFTIIDSVKNDATREIEDPTLQGLSPEEKRYTLSGKLSEDADLQLKTPKLIYTQEMWTSEVEKSLQPLDLPTFNQIVGYVTETKEVPYLIGNRSKNYVETEYQRDFKTKGADGKPIYATPDNDTLKDLSQTFRPATRSEFATNVRVGMGPGSWFEIDPLSELMRQTDMSMEDRMLFAEDVKKMRESNRFDREFSNIRTRMKNIGWIDSDGDGTIRIVDDFVGEFTYSDVTYRSVRIAATDDIPTHVRLNHVYFDTIRGREDDKTVLRLVPFYIVSLYKREDTFRRLRVRNRADRTFLPRQKKLSDLYNKEDYKGYDCSICLNQSEFDALIKRQVTNMDRRILQIPGPFLFKYHKLLYKNAKENMKRKLIMRKRDPRVTLGEPILSVGEADDMSAPFSDGMIRLGDDIQTMSATDGAVKVNGRYFDVDGNLVSEPLSSLSIDGNKVMYDNVQKKRLPYIVDLFSVHSNTMVATYGKDPVQINGTVYVCRVVNGVWEQQTITSQFLCYMLKWCKHILLVVDRDIVKGFDTNKANVQTLRLRGHMGMISSIDVKKNQIVTGSKDNHLIVWKSQEPPIAKKSKVLVKDSSGYRFGNVKNLDTGSVCEVNLLKTDREKEKRGTYECTPSAHLKTLYGHTNAVEFVQWGKYIVSSSIDKTVLVWKKGAVMFRFDFVALNLVEITKPMPYKKLVERNADSQSHLAELYSSGYAPFIAMCTPTIMFYGIGSILGKMDIQTGKRVLIEPSVVNSVSELPIPVTAMPDVEYFREDGTLIVGDVHESPLRTGSAVRWMEKRRKRARLRKKKKRRRKAAKLGLSLSEYMWRVLVKQVPELRKRRVKEYLRKKQLSREVFEVPEQNDMEDGSDSGWTSEEDSLSGLDDEGFEDYGGLEIVYDILSPYSK